MRIHEIISGRPRRTRSVSVFHHFMRDDGIANWIVGEYLEESGHRYDLGKGRSVVFHRGHTPQNQDHLHFYLKKNHLYALNRDGTAHDASHGMMMHRWAMDTLTTNYPDFIIPKKGLIEHSFLTTDPYFLVEAFVFRRPLVPINILRAAINIASMYP
jgi:hypothetical protein